MNSSNSAMGGFICYQQCRTCGHGWVHYLGERDCCFMCGRSSLSQPISLAHLREAFETNRVHFCSGRISRDEYDVRRRLLLQRYRLASPVFADRAHEIHTKVSDAYLRGNLSNHVLDQLTFCFHAFRELGLNDAAFAVGSLVGVGYAQRGQARDLGTTADFADLAAALAWFRTLGLDEWEATTNVETGLKALVAVISEAREKCLVLQIGLVHLSRAYRYYTEKANAELLPRTEKVLNQTLEILGPSLQAAAAVEAARVNATSRVQAAELQSLATMRAGELISESVNALASRVQAGLTSLSSSFQLGLDTMAKAIEQHGGRVSAAMKTHAFVVGEAIDRGSSRIGAQIYQHAEKTKEGLAAAGTEIGLRLKESSQHIAESLGGLGNKMAAGLLGGAAVNALILDGTLRDVATSVTPQIRQGLQNLKLVQETPIDVNEQLQEVLVGRGLDEANKRIHPLGLDLDRWPGPTAE